jgi:hypothetical protein
MYNDVAEKAKLMTTLPPVQSIMGLLTARHGFYQMSPQIKLPLGENALKPVPIEKVKEFHSRFI